MSLLVLAVVIPGVVWLVSNWHRPERACAAGAPADRVGRDDRAVHRSV